MAAPSRAWRRMVDQKFERVKAMRSSLSQVGVSNQTRSDGRRFVLFGNEQKERAVGSVQVCDISYEIAET